MVDENVKAAALAYHEGGWATIPLVYRTGDVDACKRPLIASWREYQTRMPSRELVDDWFTENPHANIGILTGRVSGLVVVDFDGQIAEPIAWLRTHMPTVLHDRAPIARTGGGGFHVFYGHPGGTVKNGVRVGQIENVSIDVRGDGGYVVAPPSQHGSGAPYEWYAHYPPVGPLPMLPESIRALVMRAELRSIDGGQVTAKQASAFVPTDISGLMMGVRAGSRNDAAARLAGWWLNVTRENTSATTLALEAWNQLNTPPLDRDELLATVASIARLHAAEPARDRQEPDADPDTTVMDAPTWIATVRNMPPRQGTQIRSIPGLRELGGLVPRDLILLAGRPGMGKSTAAWGAVHDAAVEHGLPTIVFSTEMTAGDVARWMASYLHGVQTSQLTPAQWHHACDVLAKSPITICDQGSQSIDDIVGLVRARPETRFVVIDHVQRIVGDGRENRNLELGQVAQKLKSLAKDIPCTVLALSQMNRSGDMGCRPRLGMLRDSGELEQEADAVMFLWTSADNIAANPLEVEFYLAKNRHGAMVQTQCLFHKDQKRFEVTSFGHEVAVIEQHARRTELARAVHDGSDYLL